MKGNRAKAPRVFRDFADGLALGEDQRRKCTCVIRQGEFCYSCPSGDFSPSVFCFFIPLMILQRFLVPAATGLSLVSAGFAQSVRFEKHVLTDHYFCDGINAGDLNRDGHPDIVAGPYWYEGPDFQKKHEFYPAVPQPTEEKPTDSMFSFVYDFNNDGWPDILVLGRVLHHSAYWYENPGKAGGPWKKHFAIHRVYGESPDFVDIDGDGKPEILSHWEDRWGWWGPNWNEPTKPWRFHPVSEKGKYREYFHGTGVGDMNGDGRMDIVCNEGWWEQPKERGQPWVSRPYKFSNDRGGAQILIYDVDGDGDNDVVTAINAHGWGLSWFERDDEPNGTIRFKEHRMMGTREEESQFGVAFSQPHALCLGDINGDGMPDVITGKRRWAHGPKGDVEPMGTPVNYWFELRRDSKKGAHFIPHLIDDASALGTQVVAVDVNGDGAPDVLTASKLGAFLFINRRN